MVKLCLLLLAFACAAPLTVSQTVLGKTRCLETSTFTIFSGYESFDEAAALCRDLDPPNQSVLAAIRNKAQLDLILDVLKDFYDRTYWIGLQYDYSGRPGTARFEYLSEDQTGLLRFIDVGIGTFPWAELRPLDFSGLNCVYLFEEKTRFYNDECDTSKAYICSSNCAPEPISSPGSSLIEGETTSSPVFFAVTGILIVLVLISLYAAMKQNRITRSLRERVEALEVNKA